MGKTKKQCLEAIEFYKTEVHRIYPEAEIDVLPDTMAGFDVWVELSVPDAQVIPAVQKVAHLENVIEDRFGVSIATLTGALEEAA
jgi:hypothetical protein